MCVVYHKKELDRLAIDLSWKSSQIEGNTYSLLETERLMGWPDNHTKYDSEDKLMPDTQRYKMCGNGVASPVAKWVAEQIKKTYLGQQPENLGSV
jgi:site-specific DNA-cytosine methylase